MKRRFSYNTKAPRMRKGEFSKSVVTKKLFTKFKKEFPEYKDMSWSTFYAIWLEIAGKIRHEVVYNPLGVKLSSYCGELKVQYVPYLLDTTDYQASTELGYKVPYMNLETRGKVFRVKWERREAVKWNKILQFYAFDSVRETCRMAHNYFKMHPDRLRTARVTLGGYNIWRQKMKNK